MRRWIKWPAMLACIGFGGLLAPGSAFASNGWSAPVRIDPGGMLRSVSCSSPSFCVATDSSGSDGSGRALTYNGSSWSAPVPIDPGDFSYGGGDLVSCASASFCAAVDFGDRALIYNGSSWSAPVTIDTGGSKGHIPVALDSVSCPSASFCVAADDSGRVLTYNGSSWSAPVEIDPHAAPYHPPGSALVDNETAEMSVSCASVSFCLAEDNEGYTTTYHDGLWGAPVQNAGFATVSLHSVSCVSPSFCAANEQANNMLFYNGSSWSLAPGGTESSGSLAGSLSVSCSSVSFCAAVKQAGTAYIYDGASWGAPEQIDSLPASLASVSCVSASFCVAVDTEGNVLTYGPRPAPAPIATATIATLTRLSESNATFAAGRSSTPLTGHTARRVKRETTFSFALDEAATVTVEIDREVLGRHAREGCPASSRRLAHEPKCIRYTPVATLTRTGHPGTNRLLFTGRIHGSALKPGHYRALFSATDAAGTSKPRAIGFTIG